MHDRLGKRGQGAPGKGSTPRAETLGQAVAAGRIRVIRVRNLNTMTIRRVPMRVIGQPVAPEGHGAPLVKPQIEQGFAQSGEINFADIPFVVEPTE